MTVTVTKVQPQEYLDLRKAFTADPIHQCITASLIVYKGEIDGEMACIWGLVPPTIMSTHAYIWLQTTPISDQHTFILVRYSQIMVQEMLKEYDALVGHCRVTDERAIRWVRWLGAVFDKPQGQLVPFIIRRKHG
jgi:hypothetical protein